MRPKSEWAVDPEAMRARGIIVLVMHLSMVSLRAVNQSLISSARRLINGLPQDRGAGQPTGNLTFSGFQMSISPPLGLHCKSNSHPWGPIQIVFLVDKNFLE